MLAHVGLASVPVLVACGPAPRRATWIGVGTLLAAAVVGSHFADAAVCLGCVPAAQGLGAGGPVLGLPRGRRRTRASPLVATASVSAAPRCSSSAWPMALVPAAGSAGLGTCVATGSCSARRALLLFGSIHDLTSTARPTAPWHSGSRTRRFQSRRGGVRSASRFWSRSRSSTSAGRATSFAYARRRGCRASFGPRVPMSTSMPASRTAGVSARTPSSRREDTRARRTASPPKATVSLGDRECAAPATTRRGRSRSRPW